MRSIKIFVEGGGETNASGQGELRLGFNALFQPQKEAARVKRVKLDFVFHGGRGKAVDEFAWAVKAREATFVVLVVDAEDAVNSLESGRPTPEERVKHLVARDGWTKQLRGAEAGHVHLMTRCMEAWLLADTEVLAEYYGKGFRENALPRRKLLDDVEKPDVYAALEKATKGTTKGSYGKIKHASALLKLVRSNVVADRCVSFQQLTTWLDATIAGV